jgi:hypothetical protein
MSATKLTETQQIVLSAAARRGDRCAVRPPHLKGAAALRVVKKLIDLGLIEEVRARSDLPVWRRGHDGRPMALRITSDGSERIRIGRRGLGKDSVLESETGGQTEQQAFVSHSGGLAATGEPLDAPLLVPAPAPSRRGSSRCFSAPRARPFRPS